MCLGGRAFVGCPGTAFDCVCGYAVAFVFAIGAQWLGMCLIGSAVVGCDFCAATIGMCDVRAALFARVCAPSSGGCANIVGSACASSAATSSAAPCALRPSTCATSAPPSSHVCAHPLVAGVRMVSASSVESARPRSRSASLDAPSSVDPALCLAACVAFDGNLQ